ncbi:Tfp pilus assembly protein FimT/FimU [Candidatus Uabimicrobium sp. HlEnr_7]|uniref:pilus assembly FimT family protein n=1 Tax=Candidatus Uabimicrobium helgolandensis TaxID=3095367 RepID=UPI00355679C6
MLLNKKHFKAFTLIELLVVISIIVMIAAAVLPTTLDFMKKSRLKGAASMIKMACLQARSQAISQRERQFVVVYTQANAEVNTRITVTADAFDGVPGAENQQARVNTIQIFDSNENNPNREFESRTQAEEFPEFISIQSLGGDENFGDSLVLEFSPTGSIRVRSGFAGDLPTPGTQAFTNNEADIVIQQDNGEHIALVDIIRNTGQVRSTIRTP